MDLTSQTKAFDLPKNYIKPTKKGHQIGGPFDMSSAWEAYFSVSLEVPAKKPLL